MFKALLKGTRGYEYSRVAKCLNKILCNIPKDEESCIVTAYAVRISILDRVEMYDWPLSTPISVPMLPSLKTLEQAVSISIKLVNDCALEHGGLVDCLDIIDKDGIYTEIDSKISEFAKEAMMYP
jgi:hypothetical protein